MSDYVISISTFHQKFDEVVARIIQGDQIMITRRSEIVGEFVPSRKYRPVQDTTTQKPVNTPDILEKTKETAQTLNPKNPPSDTTHAQNAEQKIPDSGFSWEENAGDMDAKLAALLKRPN